MSSELLLSHLLHHSDFAVRSLRRGDVDHLIEAVMLVRACAKAFQVPYDPDGVLDFSEVYLDMLPHLSDDYPLPENLPTS